MKQRTADVLDAAQAVLNRTTHTLDAVEADAATAWLERGFMTRLLIADLVDIAAQLETGVAEDAPSRFELTGCYGCRQGLPVHNPPNSAKWSPTNLYHQWYVGDPDAPTEAQLLVDNDKSDPAPIEESWMGMVLVDTPLLDVRWESDNNFLSTRSQPGSSSWTVFQSDSAAEYQRMWLNHYIEGVDIQDNSQTVRFTGNQLSNNAYISTRFCENIDTSPPETEPRPLSGRQDASD